MRSVLGVLVLVAILGGCAPTVAHWHASYADNLSSSGDIHEGDKWVCPDHITTSKYLYSYTITTYSESCTGGKYPSCTTIPITTWIPVYEYTDHAIVDGTCQVAGVSQ